MTEPDRETETTDGVNRRTLLKGAAGAGMTGSALVGTASATGNEIVFEGATDERFEYRVTVTGEIVRHDWTEPDDAIVDGRTAEGSCAGDGVDDYLFSGEIAALSLKGPGKVFVNGELVKDTTRTFAERFPNKITVETRAADPAYSFRVSGRVVKGPNAGATDEILDGTTVRGRLGQQLDSGPDLVDDYFYSGALVFEETDAPLTVTVELNRDS